MLSHAHIDHSGALPCLIRAGFKGRIHATPATADLARVMLMDSAHIQEKDAAWLSRRGRARVEPLYTLGDVERTVECFEVHGYHEAFEVVPAARATFFDAGHILGSALVQLDVRENGSDKRLLFTGDLGRPCLPILRDPERHEGADVYISESTYGDRVRDERVSIEDQALPVFARLIERKAKILVPAFAVGRTQEIVYVLTSLWNAGRLPRVPLYVDSPLAREATRVFQRHPECYDDETRALLDDQADPLGWRSAHYVESVDESKSLNDVPGPCVIVAASGMCEAGRILHHLRHGIEDPHNAVLMVGFQAEHTLGRQLIEGRDPVHILGDEFHPRAEVVVLDAFSAHADGRQLVAYAARFTRRPRQICLVHGELPRQEVLARKLAEVAGYTNIAIPSRGESAIVQ